MEGWVENLGACDLTRLNSVLPRFTRVPHAAAHVRDRGSDIAKLALQYSVANEDFSSCVTGSANPDRVNQWCDWLEEPMDEVLVSEVKEILKPIHNWVYVEGRPENNDQPA